MAITIPASVTGSAQTGLTAPTYTTTVDQAEGHMKQVAVTALGGTQTGVLLHSVNVPFTISVFRPKQMLQLGRANPVTGQIASVPKNVYKVIVRKGVTPAFSQTPDTALFRAECHIPAGSDTYDIVNVRAGLSAFIGTLQSISAGLGDTLNNGVL